MERETMIRSQLNVRLDAGLLAAFNAACELFTTSASEAIRQKILAACHETMCAIQRFGVVTPDECATIFREAPGAGWSQTFAGWVLIFELAAERCPDFADHVRRHAAFDAGNQTGQYAAPDPQVVSRYLQEHGAALDYDPRSRSVAMVDGKIVAVDGENAENGGDGETVAI